MMISIEDPEQYFQDGFPIEKPNLLLKWGNPLDVVAKESNAMWHGDRYHWEKAVFLQGLEYRLTSESGMDIRDKPFQEITALVGLDENGLWSDEASLKEFDRVAQHLTQLLGPPKEKSRHEEGEGSYFWSFGKIRIHLLITEIHCYRCNLSISCNPVF